MGTIHDNTPDYPIISWKVPVTAGTINVTYNLATFSADISAASLWGFATAVGGVAEADSLMGVLAAAVQDAMTDPAKHNVAAAVITGGYEWSTGTEIVLKGKLSASGFAPATDIVVEFNLAAHEPIFGTGTGGNYTLDSISGIGFSDFSLDGFWAPQSKSVYDDRDFENTSFTAASLSGNNLTTVQWGDEKVFRILQFPVVYAAYIFEYRRVLDVFSGPAQTDTADPNNLLQNLQAAVSASNTNFRLRVYQDDGEYRLAYMRDQNLMNSAKGFLEDISARGAMFSVTIPLRDLGADGTGAV
jgi:hypothetical protein